MTAPSGEQPVYRTRLFRPQVNDAGEVVDEELSGLMTPALGVNTDRLIRCRNCGRLLIEYASRPWRVKCGRCKTTLSSGPAIREADYAR